MVDSEAQESNMLENVLVTGGQGMLGSCISGGLKPSQDELNLLNYQDLLHYMKENNVSEIIHCAAKVGGLKYNIEHNADMLSENTEINNNVFKASIECGVKNIVSVLSTCVFPANAKEPFDHRSIYEGFPHPTNYGYAYSKRLLLVMSNAVRQQYGINCTTIIPCNMFGPRDNFNLDECHVIPALIRKAYESTDGKLVVGGSGVAKREFLYSYDCAKVIEWMLKNYNSETPLIVSPPKSVSISEVAKLISEKFELEVVWDKTIPDGQLTRSSDTSLFESLNTGVELSNFNECIDTTINWFVENYSKARL